MIRWLDSCGGMGNVDVQMARRQTGLCSANNSEPTVNRRASPRRLSRVRLIDYVVARRHAGLSTVFIDLHRCRIVIARSLQLSSVELLPL